MIANRAMDKKEEELLQLTSWAVCKRSLFRKKRRLGSPMLTESNVGTSLGCSRIYSTIESSPERSTFMERKSTVCSMVIEFVNRN